MSKGQQRTSPVKSTEVPAKTRWWSRLPTTAKIVYPVVAIVLAVAGFFITQQRQLWKDSLEKASAEIAKLKEENKSVAEREPKAEVKRESPPTSTSPKGSFEVSAKLDQTVTAQDLQITPIKLDFRPNPPRYVVTAKIRYKDLEEMQIQDAELDAVVTYPRDHGYTIKVLGTTSFSASFLIAKNP